MCDYSLEMYGSRPAREGERYVTTRFPSGSMGLAAPGQPGTAVCMACDTKLAISEIPAELAARHGFAEREEAIFVRLDSGVYRDGLRFANGVELAAAAAGRRVDGAGAGGAGKAALRGSGRRDEDRRARARLTV